MEQRLQQSDRSYISWDRIEKCLMTNRPIVDETTNKEFVEYVIQDYQKPMGVATYKTKAEMPEDLQKALPDIDELRRLLSE